MERPAAIALLYRYVQGGDALTGHCLAPGAILKAVAGFLWEGTARWEEIGILQDIDFELVVQQNGVTGALVLKTTGLPDNIRDTVQRHNLFLHLSL